MNYNAIPPKEHQFTSDKQPTNEQKKEGHKYKRNLRKKIIKYLNMNIAEFNKLADKIKKNPKDYNMLDMAAISYVSNMPKKDRYIFDYRDREEGKAIQPSVTKDITPKKELSVKWEIIDSPKKD